MGCTVPRKRAAWLSVCSFSLLLTAIAAGGAFALEVQRPYARIAPGGKNAAAYFEIANTGTRTRWIRNADSEIANHVLLHRTEIDGNGVARMRSVSASGIELGPGESLRFEPGGLHVMLIDIQQPLEVGDEFELQLSLDGGAVENLRVKVVPSAGKKRDHADHGSHSHSH